MLSRVQFYDDVNILHIMYDLLSTVNFLHKNNIIHRYLKCNNIVIDMKNNRPVIIDFSHSIKIYKPRDYCIITYYYRSSEVF